MLQKVVAEVRGSVSEIENNVQNMLLSLELLGGLDLALLARDSKCKSVRFPPPPRRTCICMSKDFVPFCGYDVGAEWGLRADPHYNCRSEQPASGCEDGVPSQEWNFHSACGKGASDLEKILHSDLQKSKTNHVERVLKVADPDPLLRPTKAPNALETPSTADATELPAPLSRKAKKAMKQRQKRAKKEANAEEARKAFEDAAAKKAF